MRRLAAQSGGVREKYGVAARAGMPDTPPACNRLTLRNLGKTEPECGESAILECRVEKDWVLGVKTGDPGRLLLPKKDRIGRKCLTGGLGLHKLNRLYRDDIGLVQRSCVVARNFGICQVCRNRVPAEHVIRDGKVYFKKLCPDCGPNEGLISSDAAAWQLKRDIYQYDPESSKTCTLDCGSCGHDHNPRLLFLDVTNRCNLNCPICLAIVPGMGFEFNPPLSYFERIFDELGTWTPPPRVELFGGEPTVREDLFDIIAMAQRNNVPVSVVTNGVRLADDDYCKRLSETGVDFLLAFDGRDPKIYEQMRGSGAIYAKKLKAVENIKKYSKRRHTLVCTLARGLNDQHMRDHFEFAHEQRSFIRRLFFIPLTETWEEGDYEAKEMTTPEDAEHILQEAFPGEKLEFIPAGLFGFVLPALKMFGTERIRFAGVHPNCESAAFVVSDGERYLPLAHFLKMPLPQLAAEIVIRAKKINPRLQRLDPKKRFQRWRGRLMALRAILPVILRAANFRKIMRGNRFLTTLRILGGLLIGRRLGDQLKKHTNVKDGVPVVILPFEEWHSLDSARLEQCRSAFVYLDPETDRLGSMAFCMWCLHRKEMFRKIAARYQPSRETAGVGVS